MSLSNKTALNHIVEKFETSALALRHHSDNTLYESDGSAKAGRVLDTLKSLDGMEIGEKIAAIGKMWQAAKNIGEMLGIGEKDRFDRVQKKYSLSPAEQTHIEERYRNGLRSLQAAVKNLYVDFTQQQQKANGIKPTSKEKLRADVKDPKKLDDFMQSQTTSTTSTTESFKQMVARHKTTIAESKTQY